MSRYFDNPYPEYSDSSCSKSVIENVNGELQVSTEYKSAVNETLHKLMECVENKLTVSNTSDYSIYTGLSGLVTFYIHYSQISDGCNIDDANKLTSECLKSVGKRPRITYLCGDVGPLTNAALVHHLLKDEQKTEFYVNRLLSLYKKVIPGNEESIDDIPDEILFGRAGYLYSLLLLNHYNICSAKIIPLIPPLVETILNSGIAMVIRKKIIGTPLMYEWHDKKYYGAAHGISGILVMLMQASAFLPPGALADLIKPTVDYMILTLFPSGNMPSSENSPNGDKLVHWCHGAPGAVFLFGMAYKYLKDSKYLEIAKKCARVVWLRGLLKKGYGLCHGSSGNGYALLFMYQITHEPRYLYEAVQFGDWCMQYGKHGCSVPDRPYSLFEGLVGNAYFLMDTINPNKAAFPGFILPPE